MLTKCTKDTLCRYTLYSLRVVKYNKSESQNLQDLKQNGEGLIKFQLKLGQLKLGYHEKQFFVAVSVNSYKNGSFYGRCVTNFYKIIKSCIIGMYLGVLGQRSNF